MKRRNGIFMFACLAVFILILLFVPRISRGDNACLVVTPNMGIDEYKDVTSCIVNYSAGSVENDMAYSVSPVNDACGINDSYFVFFEDDLSGAGRPMTANIKSQVTLKFKDGAAGTERLIVWGVPLNIEHNFSLNDQCSIHESYIKCKKNGSSTIRTTNVDGQLRTALHIDYTNISSSQAPFNIVGPGTFIFRDLDIQAFCAPGFQCGPVFKLSKQAKLIFINTRIISSQGIKTVIDVDSTENESVSHDLAFGQACNISGLSEINAWADSVFDLKSVAAGTQYENGMLLRPSDFPESNVIFSHVGSEDHAFWDQSQGFTSVDGQLPSPIECKVDLTQNICVITNTNSFVVWSAIDPDTGSPPTSALVIERNADSGQNGAVVLAEGIKFETIDIPNPPFALYTFPFASGFDFGNHRLVTNMGYPVKFTMPQTCPDGSASVPNGSGEPTCQVVGGTLTLDQSQNWVLTCNAPFIKDLSGSKCICDSTTNTTLVGDQCQPKAHYEWENGDPKSGRADFECIGDAVPVYDVPYNDHSKDKIDRCVCPGGSGPFILRQELIWIGSVSKCTLNSFLPSGGGSTPSGSGTTKPSSSGTTNTTTVNDSSETVSSSEQACMDAHGTWTGLGCDIPEALATRDSNSAVDSGSSGGCSLISPRDTRTMFIWLFFMIFPLPVILWRRTCH